MINFCCHRRLFVIKRKAVKLFLLCSFAVVNAIAQQSNVSFTSSDKKLELAFSWAKNQALHYRGNPADPVGPWYESALPPRDAFCMRDVSHQSIGAEILNLQQENENMFNLFAKNISFSKNWCSYWEINKWGKPAPDDYRNDHEFWYNLPANFDVLYASWRLYLWTGDINYINGPAFRQFQEKTIKDYISTWVLQVDSLLKRPAHPNVSLPFDENDPFKRCRGLPSYSEGVPNLKMGVDLVAALYRGLITYSMILNERGNTKEAAIYETKAETYRQALERDWWSEKNNQYYTYYSNDHQFGMDEGETFLLWFDALKDTTRINKTLARLAAVNPNVENMSYYPVLFYTHGRWTDARRTILYLADPSTKRREYPEVSYGIIEGFVQGLMGITPDSRYKNITTIFRGEDTTSATIDNLPLTHSLIKLQHVNHQQSILTNAGKTSFKWKAMFYGNYRLAIVNGVKRQVKKITDSSNTEISFVETTIKPGEKVNIKVEN